MWNASLYEVQAGIKVARTNINNLRYADDGILMAESEEELESLESERGELKTLLKTLLKHSKNEDHGIWSHYFMTNRWETLETVTNFNFKGSQMQMLTAANLDSILKSRDITLPIKVRLVMAMFFPVVMCGCESWTIKKAECWRIDAFEFWCWRRLLRVPWTARRLSRLILKEISLEYSWEVLMLRL